jgi:hypothetical protein
MGPALAGSARAGETFASQFDPQLKEFP